jgi:hypothetical protein
MLATLVVPWALLNLGMKAAISGGSKMIELGYHTTVYMNHITSIYMIKFVIITVRIIYLI